MQKSPVKSLIDDIDETDGIFNRENENHQNTYRFLYFLSKEEESKRYTDKGHNSYKERTQREIYLDIVLEYTPKEAYDMFIRSAQNLLKESGQFCQLLKTALECLPEKFTEDIKTYIPPPKKQPIAVKATQQKPLKPLFEPPDNPPTSRTKRRLSSPKKPPGREKSKSPSLSSRCQRRSTSPKNGLGILKRNMSRIFKGEKGKDGKEESTKKVSFK